LRAAVAARPDAAYSMNRRRSVIGGSPDRKRFLRML
jgi:hypothetical protein